LSAERLATHALGCFLTDVLRPLRTRLAQAVQARCDWRVRWARSEAAEAERFLLLGRTLGLYPIDQAEALLQSQAELWREGAQAVSDWTPALRQDWLATNTALQAHTLQPAVGAEGDALRRARARSVALLQSNLLASSRLGHGLAAEALAMIAFQRGADCLQALETLQDEPQSDELQARRLQLAMWLDEPGAEPPDRPTPKRGVALVASVFHALQYARALGYMHTERDVLTSGAPAPPDPLQELVGASTGDLLHSTQYWRLNLLDAQFVQEFESALNLASLALFALDPTVAQALPMGGAQAFADDVLLRWRPAAAFWRSIHLVPLAVGAAAQDRQQQQLGAGQKQNDRHM